MDEYQSRKQPPQVYPTSHNLAKQPYSFPNQDEIPLEEDANVVPLPKPRSVDGIAEDPLQPRSAPKRKQANAGKGRSTTSKKSAKTRRASQAIIQTPYADELQQLEMMAERINQILAERSQRKAWGDSAQAIPPPRNGQPAQGAFIQQYPQAQKPSAAETFAQPSLEDEETEALKQQAQRIRKRLSQLEAFIIDEGKAADLSEPSVNSGLASTELDDDQLSRHPFEASQAPSFSQNRLRYSSPPHQWEQFAQQPSPYPDSPSSTHHRSEYDAWLVAQELRRLNNQEPSSGRSPQHLNGRQPEQKVEYHDPIHDPRYQSVGYREYSRSQPSTSNSPHRRRNTSTLLRNLQNWRIFDLPQRPIDRLADAVGWLVAATVVRVSVRYVLLSVPFLTPVLTLLMVTPATIALFLALFAPRTKWVLFYRLFLIMLGLFIGGKF